ncbi:MAG: hypothetical protein H7145_14565 [Akkermansiaceae bacterium]|nr:hypothetical protein [Armatimonadota bacterium]
MDTETFDPRDEVIEDFLEGQPRAARWREYRLALQTRLDAAKEKVALTAEGSGERTELDDRIKELREQIRVLAEEEAITQFVEDSVRSSLSRPRALPDFDDDGY